MQQRREDRIELDQRVEDVVEAVQQQDVAVGHARASATPRISSRSSRGMFGCIRARMPYSTPRNAVPIARPLPKTMSPIRRLAQVADPLAERCAVLPTALVRLAADLDQQETVEEWTGGADSTLDTIGLPQKLRERMRGKYRRRCAVRSRLRARLLEREPDTALAHEVVIPDQIGRSIDGQLVDQPAVDVVPGEDVGARRYSTSVWRSCAVSLSRPSVAVDFQSASVVVYAWFSSPATYCWPT